MTAFRFKETFVVAITAKWCEGSVDEFLYTDKARAEAIRDAHNKDKKLEGKYAAEVMELPEYISMMEIVGIRDREGD